MAKRSLTFDSVRAVAEEFPDLVEGTTYGSPAILLGKRMVACLPTHKSAEPGSLAVRTDFEQREAMLRDDPETFYLKEHYVNHPVVLVRLARLGKDQLRDLIAAGRQFVLAHEARKRRPVKRK
jgi:hypothetical protein